MSLSRHRYQRGRAFNHHRAPAWGPTTNRWSIPARPHRRQLRAPFQQAPPDGRRASFLSLRFAKSYGARACAARIPSRCRQFRSPTCSASRPIPLCCTAFMCREQSRSIGRGGRALCIQDAKAGICIQTTQTDDRPGGFLCRCRRLSRNHPVQARPRRRRLSRNRCANCIPIHPLVSISPRSGCQKRSWRRSRAIAAISTAKLVQVDARN